MYYVGIDGGGTCTTLALAEGEREIARRMGPPGIVDPRRPFAAGESLARLVRELLLEAGVEPPVEGLCAGLAGAGNAAEREAVRGVLEGEELARRVIVCQDGEIALEGALMGRPGILLVAGTGSVAWGRAEDGRVERCGGWGMVVGDEGSAYALGREGLRAALRAMDGRGEQTALLAAFLGELGLGTAGAIPSWAGRAEKGEIAALALVVARVAQEGDAVAAALLRESARQLADHATALRRRLGPWHSEPSVVLHGGIARSPQYRKLVTEMLSYSSLLMDAASTRPDPLRGALWIARNPHSSPDVRG